MAYTELVTAISNALKAFKEKIEGSVISHRSRKTVDRAIQEAEENFLKACEEKGLSPEEADLLRETEQELRQKQTLLQTKQSERQKAQKKKPDKNQLFKELTHCWQKETTARQTILDEIIASPTMPQTKQNQPIIKLSLTFAGDRKSFLNEWKELAPDRRTAIGRIWDDYSHDVGSENIGEQLFEAFQKSQPNESLGNPLQWLEKKWDNHDDLPPLIQQYLEQIGKVKSEIPDKWFKLMMTRVQDSAELILFRSDGSEAGSFQRGDLSTGQKNTAILSLLLARGNGPVLIDQPEDELDSEFLYRELVPMIRKTKFHRQLIIVTHNANIPVNADAELVYALTAQGGKGICRVQGGMDRKRRLKPVKDRE